MAIAAVLLLVGCGTDDVAVNAPRGMLTVATNVVEGSGYEIFAQDASTGTLNRRPAVSVDPQDICRDRACPPPQVHNLVLGNYIVCPLRIEGFKLLQCERYRITSTDDVIDVVFTYEPEPSQE